MIGSGNEHEQALDNVAGIRERTQLRGGPKSGRRVEGASIGSLAYAALHPPWPPLPPPRREEEYRLETDEFFFLLATGSQFLQIILVGGKSAPASAEARTRSKTTT
jgi:hypothetical protein